MTELLREFLADYLHIVEPDVCEHLELGSLVFPDVAGLSPLDGTKVLVAEARTKQGEQLTILVLVLVEPEPLGQQALGRRLGEIFAALDLRLGRPVLVSVLFLRGGKPSVNLDTAAVTTVAGLDNVRLYFSTFGLEGAAAEYYLARPEPLAWCLAARMGSKRFDRAQLEAACRQRILAADLDEPCRLLLLGCLHSPRVGWEPPRVG